MNTTEKQKIYEYINNQIIVAEDRIYNYVYHTDNHKKKFQRNCFLVLRQNINKYKNNNSYGARINVLHGLRGTGKTTLLAQMYNDLKNVRKERKLFISLDEVVSKLNVKLSDVLSVYEDMLEEGSFEKLKSPIFLFLDEVHFDKDWSTTLKILYDKTNKIFVLATGSSALSLHNTPDLARRSHFIELYPMKFTEYVKIKYGALESKGLSSRIKDCIFNSNNAQEVYDKVSKETANAQKYWIGIDYHKEVDNYIQYNNLPFTLDIDDNALITEQMNQMLSKIMTTDISHNGNFSFDIIKTLPSLLYILASTDQFNISRVCSVMQITRPTLASILDALEKTGLIWRVYPYTSHYNQVSKSSKYLFTSPTFRTIHFTLTQSVIRNNNEHMGKLLEDTIGLILKKEEFYSTERSLTYDGAEGGADFIVQNNNRTIVIEVGYGNKRINQVIKTMKRFDKDKSYGIVVSKNPLKINKELNIVEIPITYFLLI